MTKHAFSGKTQCPGAVKMMVQSTYYPCRRPQGQFPAQETGHILLTSAASDAHMVQSNVQTLIHIK